MQVDDAELTTLHGMVVTSPVHTVADVLCSMRVSRCIEVVTDGLRRGVLDGDTSRFTWDDIDRRPDHVGEVMLRTIAVRSRSARASTPQVGGRGASK
jgi:hypothetical protein